MFLEIMLDHVFCVPDRF